MERSVWLEGETITFQVRVSPVSDSSELQWQWLQDGRPVSTSGTRVTSSSQAVDQDAFLIELRVEDARETDSGLYSCEVSNPLGRRVVEFGSSVGVLGLRVTSVGSPANTSSLAAGTDLDLTCLASLSPHFPPGLLAGVQVMWSKPGASLEQPRHRLTSSSTLSATTYSSTLSISPLTSEDGGMYVCSVTSQPLDDGGGQDLVVNYTRTLLIDSESGSQYRRVL